MQMDTVNVTTRMFDNDPRCIGKIEMVAYSTDPTVGRVRYDRTTVKLDKLSKNFYTRITDNRDPLHRAYFAGSTIKLHIENCITGKWEFDSFSVVSKS